jgi:DNA-binding transcriptional ArsR family regulator
LEYRGPEIPARGKLAGSFFRQQNELCDLFQPIIGLTAVAVYTNLARRAYGDDPTVKYSLRDLARDMGISHPTVSRAIATLEYLGMIRLCKRGGNIQSEAELVDLKRLAEHMGARYDGRAASFVLPQESMRRLKAQVEVLRATQQGKRPGEQEALKTKDLETTGQADLH